MEIKNKLQDDIFKIPHDKVKLPSGGLLYTDIPAVVDVEYMVTSDEDILYSNKLMDNGVVFNELVKLKLLDKNINVSDLLIGDFNQILVFLRISAYGNIYNAKTYDPDINEFISQEVDLKSLTVKGLGADFNENGEFEFVLPTLNKKITFKLLTVGLGDYINKTAESRKKNNVIPYLTTKLETMIMSVEGITDKLYISQFVKIIPPVDRIKLSNYISSIEPKVDLEYTFKSKIKGTEYKDNIVLGIDFFYPQDLI